MDLEAEVMKVEMDGGKMETGNASTPLSTGMSEWGFRISELFWNADDAERTDERGLLISNGSELTPVPSNTSSALRAPSPKEKGSGIFCLFEAVEGTDGDAGFAGMEAVIVLFITIF